MVDKIIAKLKPRSAPFNVRFFLYIAPEIYTKTKPIIKSASSPTNSVEENGNFKINLIKITKHPALGPYINEVIKAGADGIAIMSLLFESKNIHETIKKINM